MRLTRRERIRLLLTSYADAVSPGRTPSDIPGVPHSRPPTTTALWQEGSYYELGRALESLRVDGYQKIHRHLCGHYLGGPDYPCGKQGPQKRYVERGVDLLVKRMPANIYVPRDIAEHGGFLPGEASTAVKPRARVAA